MVKQSLGLDPEVTRQQHQSREAAEIAFTAQLKKLTDRLTQAVKHVKINSSKHSY
jgi:hypothetical protein